MSILRFVSSSLVAATLAVTPVVLLADDDAPSKDGKTVQSATVEKAPARPFSALKAVKATPMSSSELADVKGLHVHFWNPGAPFPTAAPHLAGDVKTKNNWQDLYGQGDVGMSYRGLCKAATNGSAIFINPGGGCGF